MDVLADVLQNALIEASAVERERAVILREAEEVSKSPFEVVFDNLHTACFPDHGLGLTILGPEQNIKTINRQDLKEYIATHYTGPRMVIAGAGAIDHDHLVSLSKKLFGSVPGQNHPFLEKLLNQKPEFVARDAKVHVTDNLHYKETSFTVAFPGVGWADADAIPLFLLQCLLGAWESQHAGGANSHSRMIRLASQGLARSVQTYNTMYKFVFLFIIFSISDTGLFGVFAQCDKDNTDELVKLVCSELASLCYAETYSEEWLHFAKAQMKSAIMSSLDNTSSVFFYLKLCCI